MRGLTQLGRAAVLALACVGVAMYSSSGMAMDESAKAIAAEPTVKQNPDAKAQAKAYEFAVFKKHCTQCHNSIADPERPGKTRDEWYRIINLMESHGLTISQEEADMIVDLLFNLRRGIEDKPG